jgi:hypothetical protein
MSLVGISNSQPISDFPKNIRKWRPDYSAWNHGTQSSRVAQFAISGPKSVSFQRSR